MKNRLMIILTALAMIGLTTSSFAGKINKVGGVSYTEIEGVVVKLIPDQGALMVKDNDDGKEIHIHVDKDTLSALAVGNEIKFKMQGSNCIVEDVIKK